MAEDIPGHPVDRPGDSATETRPESESDRTLDEENAGVASIPKPEDDVPPDGGYGWVCVACNFFINGHTWGVNSSYAIYLSYYLSHDYFPNTSALSYAFIGGLSFSQAVFIAPLATRVIHLYGTRVCLHIGVFLETLSLISSSFARQKWQIILSQGLCFGYGMGFLFVGSVGIPPQWFTKKRSLANAIAAAGSGLGGLMYSLISQRAIDSLGLPWAFRIVGICAFVVNLTASNLLRDRNRQVGSHVRAFDTNLLKRPEFLLMQGWSILSMLGYVVVLFSLPSYAHAIGLTPQQGSIVGALLNLGQMIGRPFVGLASDRYGRLNLATLFTFICGMLCLMFWIPVEVAPSPMGLLCFFAIIGGCLAGTYWCTIAPVSAEVLGLRDLPAGLSMTWLIMVPPTTFAEPIALELRSTAKHWKYIGPEVFTAFMYIGAAGCLWLVRGWKVGELEALDRRKTAQLDREEQLKRNDPQRQMASHSPTTPTTTATKPQENQNQNQVEIEKEMDTGGFAVSSISPLEEKRVDGASPNGPPEEVRIELSVAKAGWSDTRDLFRRMVVWKNV